MAFYGIVPSENTKIGGCISIERSQNMRTIITKRAVDMNMKSGQALDMIQGLDLVCAYKYKRRV